MSGCRRALVAGALTLVVLGGTTGTGIADEADRRKTSLFTTVFSFTDGRITESSGLALSRAYDGLAYTINDSGNAPLIFAITGASGAP